jgi:hypothetical protein
MCPNKQLWLQNVNIQVPIEARAKCVMDCFVLGSYMLQEVSHISFKCSRRILCPVVFGISTCRTTWSVDLNGLRNEPLEFLPPDLLTGLLLHKCSQFEQTIKHLFKIDIVAGGSPPKILRNLLFTGNWDLGTWNCAAHIQPFLLEILFLQLRTASVGLKAERFGNWSGTNHNPYRITHSQKFSFHSCAFQFMSNHL